MAANAIKYKFCFAVEKQGGFYLMHKPALLPFSRDKMGNIFFTLPASGQESPSHNGLNGPERKGGIRKTEVGIPIPTYYLNIFRCADCRYTHLVWDGDGLEVEFSSCRGNGYVSEDEMLRGPLHPIWFGHPTIGEFEVWYRIKLFLKTIE